MTLWKPSRHPDLYPAYWHEILRAAPGTYVLKISTDALEITGTRRKFNAFRASLREHPHHPTSRLLALQFMETFIEHAKSGQGLALMLRKRLLAEDSSLSAIQAALGDSPQDMQPKG